MTALTGWLIVAAGLYAGLSAALFGAGAIPPAAGAGTAAVVLGAVWQRARKRRPPCMCAACSPGLPERPVWRADELEHLEGRGPMPERRGPQAGCGR